MTYFPRLPDEVGEVIFKFISPYKRAVILPGVCKAWNSFCSKLLVDKEEVIQSSPHFYNESDDDFNVRISKTKLLFEQFGKMFFANFDEVAGDFDLGLKSMNYSQDFFNRANAVVFTAKGNTFDGYGPTFYVNWTPGEENYSITSKGKWKDLHTSFAICLVQRNAVWEQEYIYRRIELAGYAYTAEKRGIISWEYTPSEPLEPVIKLIQGLITVSLKIRIEQLAKLNLCTLKEEYFFNENLACSTTLPCNKEGVIVNGESSTDSFQLIVKNIDTAETIKTLYWEDGHQDSSNHATMEQLFRWSVISSTTDCLIREFGFARY